jgi:hypothetical protein
VPLVCGVAACGGSKQAQTTTPAPAPTPVPTLGGPTHHNEPGDKRAAVLKARLTAAGYAVHYQPISYRAGYSNAAPAKTKQTPAELARLKRLRQLQQRNNPAPIPPAQILRVDITEGSLATEHRLARELAALDGTIASQGFQTRAQTQHVAALIRQMRAESSHELFVNIYNSAADTSGFKSQQSLARERIQAETLQRGFTPADANIPTPYKVVGADVYIDLTREQIGPSGFLVDPFSQAAFNKFVALAERKLTR